MADNGAAPDAFPVPAAGHTWISIEDVLGGIEPLMSYVVALVEAPAAVGSEIVGVAGTVAVGNGTTVAVHRGGAMEFASSQTSAPAGVRIHRGMMSLGDEHGTTTPSEGAPGAMASKVTIHRGSAAAEVDPI